MKKKNIMMAVLGLMLAGSAARAEDIKVDFDGKKGAMDFTEAIKVVLQENRNVMGLR